jgi:hypothetical protein
VRAPPRSHSRTHHRQDAYSAALSPPSGRTTARSIWPANARTATAGQTGSVPGDAVNANDRLLTLLGMTDLTVALTKADGSLHRVWDAGKDAVARFDEPCREALVLMGLLARAQGFHESIVSAIRDGNPYAAFTLLRAYAENAAAIAYLSDKPQAIGRFFGDGHPLAVGKLVAHAGKHFDGFKKVYDALSEYAHPASRSVIASHRVEDLPDGMVGLGWQSAPRFKSDNDHLMACAWLWELAEAHDHLIRRLGSVLAARHG